ncbi:hypothetical protein [Rhizobium sp. BK602]|uniref:hypothetical protein n=1 Tax=Rhizobium sp. BK602 TaxID=2586986 RepID=UPI00161159F0|nr:hypothetical protein [Rhizobium sp. BK602]MBB3610965.1 hypothetical protein [Rhizobium sp. BK602]
MKRILMGALMVTLAGCSNNPDSLAQNKSSATTAKSFPENYQALYRKIHDPASRCLVGSPGVATQLILDAQLYPDLGFGEISYSMSSIYGRHFFWKAKIERQGTGSKISVVSGNSLSRDKDIRSVLRWAGGDTSC